MIYRQISALVLVAVFAGCGDGREPGDPVIDPNGQNGSPDVGVTEDGGDPGMADAGTTDGGGATELRCDDGTCELTCDVLVDPGFCWTLGLDEAYACTDGAERGQMSADGLTCTAAIEGTTDELVVTFENPVVAGQVADRDEWYFDVMRGAEECVSFDDSPTSFVLTTARGTATVLYEDETTLRVTCPTGDAWETTDLQGILGCRNADDLTSLPGISTTEIGTIEFDVSLLPRFDNLFACTFPE